MPPKKRASLKKKGITNETQATHTVDTQTENNNDELTYYKNQVQSLQKEVDSNKKQIDSLQREVDALKNQIINFNATPIVNDQGKNVFKGKIEKSSPLNSAIKAVKGCSCKGNCADKKCGCVKKGIPCQEFCRCNDIQCKNQEPDDENIDVNNRQLMLGTDDQKVLEKLGGLTLTQKVRHASEKKANKTRIFSPAVSHNEDTNNKGETNRVSPLPTTTPRRRLFNQDSNDIVDIPNLSSDFDSTLIEQNPNEKKSLIAGQSKQNVNDDNIENISPPAIIVINECVSPTSTKRSTDYENGYLSPKSAKNKSSSDSYVTRRNYGNNKENEKLKIQSVSPDQCIKKTENDQENRKSNFDKVQHSPQPITPIIQVQRVLEKRNVNASYNYEETPTKVSSNDAERSGSFESNNSEEDNRNQKSSYDFSDTSINPMVPKRQLLRSPVNKVSTTTPIDKQCTPPNPLAPKRQLARSPISTPDNRIVTLNTKRFSPPKKELAVPEVDWEQHQSELVMCNVCKRRFFPHRIEKHTISCKGI